MPGMTLQQLDILMTQRPELEGLAVELLEAFEVDKPLEQSDLEDWMQDGERELHPRDVLGAVRQALSCGWVADTPSGLCLTAEGREKIRAVVLAASGDSAERTR